MPFKPFFTFIAGISLVLAGCSKKVADKGRLATGLPKVSVSRDTIMADPDTVVWTQGPDSSRHENAAVEEIATEDLINSPFMIASFSKTPCYGKCAVFEARIYSDGKTEFYGKRNVALTGYYTGFISQASISLLLKKARETGFFSLEPIYPVKSKRILDLPNTITYIRDGNLEHNVIDNYDAPQNLRNFETYFENLIFSLSYQKSNIPVSE